MSDLEFVASCIRNEAAAWDEFLQKYSNLIYNYIHSVLKIKGKDIPQGAHADLYQEIILSLIKDDYKKLKSFKGKNGCSLASWLRIVTINFSIDYLRRLKPIVSLDEELKEDMTLKDVLSDGAHLKLETELVNKEKQKELAECIEELSLEDKYFLEFHIHKCVPLRKLKTILDVSKAALDMRKRRVVQRLKDCFKRRGFLLDF
jgi:RNA polymerase sigma factor (sigma-70 family)